MLNIDRVRGVMRAKYGSQIPKFEEPAGPLPKPNPISIGSVVPQPKDLKTLPKIPNPIMQKFNDFMDKNANKSTAWKVRKAKMAAQGLDYTKSRAQIGLENFANKAGELAVDAGKDLGNMLTSFATPDNIVGIMSQFIKDDVDINSQGVEQALGVVESISPGIGFGLRQLNDLTGSDLPEFSMNKELASRMGAGYGGSYRTIREGDSLRGKRVGGFTSSGGYRNTIQDARFLQEGIASIDSTNQDLLAKKGAVNNERIFRQNNGGFDFRMSAKNGGSLDQKINIIKYRKFNQVINVDTKQIEEFKEGGKIQTEWEPVIEDLWEPVIDIFQEGGPIKKSFEEWFNSIPKDSRASGYDYKKAYEVLDWETLYNHTKDPEKYHLYSVSPIADENGNYPFLKLGKLEENPELQGEFDWYNSEKGKEHKSKFDIVYINDRYYYVPKKFKDGGKTKEELETPEIEETNQKNLIPEGALHKNKHHMEHTEGLTQKGIPVIDNDGEQQAEIELDEIIFTLEVTKKLEELYKDGSDEAAIEAGKLLVKEILFNTDDRTGLISKCEKGGKL